VPGPGPLYINDMYHFQFKLKDAAYTHPTSTVNIRIGALIKDAEYDAIKIEVDNINDNLKRTALNIVNKRVGKDAKGAHNAVMQNFRSAEKAPREKLAIRSGERIFS
ncbi:hypothetical protein A2U01_0052922, partial [Trifolium medium]|nr:hypothetical protein [Trifolium medium]